MCNLINECPIDKKPNYLDDGSYLCPNDLLLGRSSSKIPYQEFGQGFNIRKRYSFVEQLVDAFWKKWTTFYFPSLVIPSKWHHKKRNMMIGDVVLIQASKELKRDWKLSQYYHTTRQNVNKSSFVC